MGLLKGMKVIPIGSGCCSGLDENLIPFSIKPKLRPFFRARAPARNRNRCFFVITIDRFDYDPATAGFPEHEHETTI